MRLCQWLIVGAVIPLSAWGQNEGISSEWDVKAKMSAMAADVARLEDLLRRVRPDDWVAKGGSDVYIHQLDSCRARMNLLIAGTEKLAKDPEKLSVALDVLYRMDTMDLMLSSLREGVRRYQGPSVADDIARFMGENSRHREMLRQHTLDLATARENELKVINAETQRCRTELSRKNEPEAQPLPVRRRGK